jgi:peptidoglycan/xylan/chitin deacetylase (PgdA/CDA1 family)
MWNGKKKALTFSYDDAVSQDIRLIEIFNKYGLKGTFNINSMLLGQSTTLVRDGVEITHNKNKPEDIPYIYKGHEVSAHTLTHPHLPALSDKDVIYQIEQDRLNLSDLVGYEVCGMAYPQQYRYQIRTNRGNNLVFRPAKGPALRPRHAVSP